MKAIHLLLAVCLSFYSALGFCYEDSEMQLNKVLNKENADRLLLLAFTDHTIDSIKGSAAPTSYRQRGNYRSSSWSERITNQIADEYDMEKLAEWPMTEVGMHCAVYQLAKDAAANTVMSELAKDKRVQLVQNMHYFKTRAENHNDPYFKLQANLKSMQIDKAHQKANGAGITIGIIDTGMDLDHPDLKGQIIKNQNLVSQFSPSFSTDKHGTAVAGVIAAKINNANGIIGIAPNAKLEAIKACWPEKPDAMEAVCNSFSLALAINTAIKDGIDILNMSLAGPSDPLLTVLLNKAIAQGIIVVAAENSSADTSENFPASLTGVISVQSLQSSATPVLLSAGTIIAQGNQVLTTLPHGTYDFISGHSIAAAEVSGIIALLLELKPHQANSEIHKALANAIMKNPAGEATGINVNAALDSICETPRCPHSTLSFDTHSFMPN